MSLSSSLLSSKKGTPQKIGLLLKISFFFLRLINQSIVKAIIFNHKTYSFLILFHFLKYTFSHPNQGEEKKDMFAY